MCTPDEAGGCRIDPFCWENGFELGPLEEARTFTGTSLWGNRTYPSPSDLGIDSLTKG